jgi:diguanylate cyclase (GGDEF)-like protein
LLVATTTVCVMATHLMVDRLLSDVITVSDNLAEALELALIGVSNALLLSAIVVRPMRRDARRERQETSVREGALRAEASQRDFETRLHRALEMAANEQAAHRATAKALERGLDGVSSELLLADSSDAHLKQALHSGGGRPGCGVEAPRDCAAIRRSQTLVFSSSDDIDACPYLDGRDGGPLAAACVPVSVAGRSIGVLHAVSEPGCPPDVHQVRRLETVATQAGSRIGMLRVMEATHLQAATDPLTGLQNRRSFENNLHDLLRRGRPFALAMADLDHFKTLNDTHGHDAGDRALRLFARTLRAALRADDVICRYGGEEFVIALPDRSAHEARAALERVQEQLVLALTAGTVPGFTASFGVTHSDAAAALPDLCRIADAALFRAKRDGRNRVIVDDGSAVAPTGGI